MIRTLGIYSICNFQVYSVLLSQPSMMPTRYLQSVPLDCNFECSLKFLSHLLSNVPNSKTFWSVNGIFVFQNLGFVAVVILFMVLEIKAHEPKWSTAESHPQSSLMVFEEKHFILLILKYVITSQR